MLIIRIGIGLSFVLLFALKQSEAAKTLATQPGRMWTFVALSIGTVLVVCGLFTRLAAALAAIGWAWAMGTELRAGAEWFVLPVRAAEYMILFTALGITGAGKYSLDHWMGKMRSTKRTARSV
jgi:uncharacterized membrane protein YphA (DoxX/SURF4 family)